MIRLHKTEIARQNKTLSIFFEFSQNFTNHVFSPYVRVRNEVRLLWVSLTHTHTHTHLWAQLWERVWHEDPQGPDHITPNHRLPRPPSLSDTHTSTSCYDKHTTASVTTITQCKWSVLLFVA